MLCFAHLLAGCAEGGHYTALLPRPAELSAAAEKKLPSNPNTSATLPANQALLDQIAQLSAQARKGQEAFASTQTKVVSTLAGARAAAVHSDAWVLGQEALSALMAAQAPSVDAQTALDKLYVETIEQNKPGLADVQRARANAALIVTQQDQLMREIRASLSRNETLSR
jgi:hypothetical protein